ncbi:MAG: hypothetical protein M1587_10325 [Thaumarchaeota archaeon]|nr:hypothetical protein [Nitrososphaerota archaeon]MDG6906449.1 hypothetical protein [Nitrososphaerota archaeon]
MPKQRPSLDLIYKEVKSVNQKLDFIEDLAEEVIVSQLPKARLTAREEKEVKKRIAEMKRSRRATLEDMRRV